MKTTIIAVGLLVSCAAHAAEPSCIKIKDVQEKMVGSTLRVLSLGEFHFLQGVYVGSPTTPQGLPPGDGALLATTKGVDNAVVIWTNKASGLACSPIPVQGAIITLMGRINTGPGDAL